ncbi:MAG: hypothetical protein L3J77_04250 [Thermoplasmata archaeon]|nr:hypothetical protein [Thermoplasmata archaeon]
MTSARSTRTRPRTVAPGPSRRERDAVPVRWLLEPIEPSVRYRTLLDLLDRPESDPDVVATKRKIPTTGWAARLFAKQKAGGHWESADQLYTPKYRSTIWNVQVLALLGVTRDDPRMALACELFLDQFARLDGGFDNAPDPHEPSELCVTGNLTRTLILAGYGDDERVRAAVDWIVRAQLADGGWHCWPRIAFGRGTLDAWEGLSALAALPETRRSPAVRRAIENGTEFYLRRELLEQGRRPYAPWRRLHFPNHYYYDVLVGLDLLSSLGKGGDPRLDPALALLESKRRSDGTWAMDRSHPDVGPGAGYSLRKKPTPMVLEPAGRPSRWITLTALRVRRRVAAARGRRPI